MLLKWVRLNKQTGGPAYVVQLKRGEKLVARRVTHGWTMYATDNQNTWPFFKQIYVGQQPTSQAARRALETYAALRGMI